MNADSGQFDAIVAGAGLWGCTIARRLAEAGRRVLVLEKRPVVGGNCRCEMADGIEVHTYGSHIFHTSNEEVWQFVNRFTRFNDYRHVVLARHGGRIYHLPIGRTLYEEFGTNDPQAIFDAFIRNYTAKQWGMPADRVDPAVIKRLKVRDSYSTDYFDDRYQGIPADGYNAMFDRMLDHENIEVRTGAAFSLESANCSDFTNSVPVFYSGPIDALFGYKFGPLPWRTLRFETEKLEVADYQHNAVVNYVDADVPFTRIHEFKHYHPERELKGEARTIIMREYPAKWQPGDEPYYPIASAESAALLARYQAEVEKINHPSFNTHHSSFNTSPRLVIGGRLGGYKYYDMDKSIEAALKAAK